MHIHKQYHFLSGIGRSGSTVLAALLSQNPKIYATATSPLMDMLCLTEQSWRMQVTQSKTHVAHGQIENIYKGVINGTWEHIGKPVIIDKHRAWPRNSAGIRAMFGIPKPKIICTVRDIASCIASFINLIEKSPNTMSAVDQILQSKGLPLTTAYRCDCIWEDFLQNVYESLWIGWRECRDCLLLIEYDDLVSNPEATLQRIYKFIEIDPFTHDFNNIQNVATENDIFWGFDGLHDIRGKVAKNSRAPEEIIGEDDAKRFAGMEFWRNDNYADVRLDRLSPLPIKQKYIKRIEVAPHEFWRND